MFVSFSPAPPRSPVKHQKIMELPLLWLHHSWLTTFLGSAIGLPHCSLLPLVTKCDNHLLFPSLFIFTDWIGLSKVKNIFFKIYFALKTCLYKVNNVTLLQRQRPGFVPVLAHCLFGVCMFSRWPHGYFPYALVFSNILLMCRFVGCLAPNVHGVKVKVGQHGTSVYGWLMFDSVS